jgi:hypothetical protein
MFSPVTSQSWYTKPLSRPTLSPKDMISSASAHTPSERREQLHSNYKVSTTRLSEARSLDRPHLFYLYSLSNWRSEHRSGHQDGSPSSFCQRCKLIPLYLCPLSGQTIYLLPLRWLRHPLVRMPRGSRDGLPIRIQKLASPPRYRGTGPNTEPVFLIALGDTHPYHCSFWWGVQDAPQGTNPRVYCKKASLCCYRVGDCQEVGPRPNS